MISRLPHIRSRAIGFLIVVSAALMTSGCLVVSGPSGFFQEVEEREQIVVSGSGHHKILLITVDGVISDQSSSSGFGLFVDESMLSRIEGELESAARDSQITAVILRINSPGGGVTASDEIYARIQAFKREQNIPVFASMGDMATSGGYYVALAADRIYASPTTVTGSIGVIMTGFTATELLDKIGIENQTYTSGENKDLMSPWKEPTPEERQIMQGVLDGMYGRFVSLVRENRSDLKSEQLETITDGRIFTAEQALNLGLVDEIGRLHDVIEAAKAAAHVHQAQVVVYRRNGIFNDNVYTQAAAQSPQTGWAAVAEQLVGPQSPRFMYLWLPGALP
ncbi:MAG: signal peptide peptidase SppA [Pseudomonadota bacterium]|nr:signal peptide peptidase SppA [Pseudomonadota bacterium]